MKWLIDAQLPRRLAMRLIALGHDAIHTLDLPEGNRTSDSALCGIADESNRIVVTKDRDFLDSFYINDTPLYLLWVTIGNVTNNDLLARFEEMLPNLQNAFSESRCVELNSSELIIHR